MADEMTSIEWRDGEALGYVVARLDTGPRQEHAEHFYRRSGYTPIANFNSNPVASFWGEKPLLGDTP